MADEYKPSDEALALKRRIEALRADAKKAEAADLKEREFWSAQMHQKLSGFPPDQLAERRHHADFFRRRRRRW